MENLVRGNIKEVTFSLIMPCYKCEDTIGKAIDSILDQDFKDWELICVVNGEWEGKKKTIEIIEQFKKKSKKIDYTVIHEANACSARNFGANTSEGRYLSFFSSDFYMFPGALAKWKKTFDEHPDADFIYSGYRLMKDGVMQDINLPARAFDPWELEIENYIDGGFPMKREVWLKGGWDPSVKSLNDWDFWLTAVKQNGFRGYCMPDFTYAAELPKEGGLSFDSHNNWLERVSYIKKKHNIKEKDICVVSLGAQPHARRIAKLLDADFKVCPQGKPHNYKAIYLLGFYVGDGSSAVAHSQIFNGAPKGCKKIVHWIGTDILQLMGAAFKVCYADFKTFIDSIGSMTNLTEFEQTKNEMLSLGIKTEAIALPIEQKIPLMPLPKEFTIATYIPKTATADHIYNLPLIKDIIKSCPDIKFLVFGGGEAPKRENVIDMGWVDGEDYINKVIGGSSCLLRLTYHDGLPVAPIEWRLAGRNAVTTVQMEHVYFAGTGVITPQNYGDRKEGIIKLIRSIKKDQVPKDIEKARQYYSDLTNPKRFRRKLEGIING